MTLLMWGASLSIRNTTESERRLLVALLDVVPESRLEPEAIGELTVEPLADGGMGSFRLTGKYGKSSHAASELQFQDLDGVLVIATLYVDPENRPKEVCIWKVNFAPLIQIPAVLPRANAFFSDE